MSNIYKYICLGALILASESIAAPRTPPSDIPMPSEDELLNFDNTKEPGQQPGPTSPPDKNARKKLGEIPSMAPLPDAESAQDTQNPMLSSPPPDPLDAAINAPAKKATAAPPP